jgi:kinesin family protein C2/C3
LRKYRRELQLRKKCHNELVRLKGECLQLCIKAVLTAAAAAAASEAQKKQETCLKTHS